MFLSMWLVRHDYDCATGAAMHAFDVDTVTAVCPGRKAVDPKWSTELKRRSEHLDTTESSWARNCNNEDKQQQHH